MFKKIGLGIIAILVLGFVWLGVAPPELLRVGANYSAKMICSNVVLANRDPEQVLQIDVQAPGNPLLKLLNVSVETDADTGNTIVKSNLLGFIGNGLAFGNKDRGCSTIANHADLDAAMKAPSFVPPIVEMSDAIWPSGNSIEPSEDPKLNAILDDVSMTGQGMRAVVVVKDGKIIGERYGEGFDALTPLLGWSMTKTVSAALIGAAIKQNYLNLDDAALFDQWADDDRALITLSDMMGMASDLKWNEGYGDVSDVTRMLYLVPDMAAFAMGLPLDDASPEAIGENFNYSSGTTVMLSQILQNRLKDDASAFPSKALFEPLGMASAVLETDAKGTFVGSSYMYANARDWARFGQLMLQRGVWNGRSLLPIGFVDWMSEAHPASNGLYGRGQVWLSPPGERSETAANPLPEGTFWAAGHDGQSIAVIPEKNLVIVRLGLTPSSLGFKPANLAQAIISAVE